MIIFDVLYHFTEWHPVELDIEESLSQGLRLSLLPINVPLKGASIDDNF